MIIVKSRNKEVLSIDNFHKRGYEVTDGHKTAFLADYFIDYYTAQLLESGDQNKIREGLIHYCKTLRNHIDDIPELHSIDNLFATTSGEKLIKEMLQIQ